MFKIHDSLPPFEAAKACHEWLRSKGVLDESHDLAWSSAPHSYRGELIAVFSRSKAEAEKGSSMYRALESYESALRVIAGECANPRGYAANALEEGARILGRTDVNSVR